MNRRRHGATTRFARHTAVTLLSAVATALAVTSAPEPAVSEQAPMAAMRFELPSQAAPHGPSPLAPWTDVARSLGEQRLAPALSSEPWLTRSTETLAPLLELLAGWPSPAAPLPHSGDRIEEPTSGAGADWLGEEMTAESEAAFVQADGLEADPTRVHELTARLPPDLTGPLFQFRWPLHGEITTYFAEVGPLSPRGHAGLDIASVWGSPVRAVEEGRIRTVALDGAYGWYIVVDHGNAVTSLYAHLSDYEVEEGQWVARGERIGFVGSTGFSTGPHLHLELRQDGILQDPLAYLP